MAVTSDIAAMTAIIGITTTAIETEDMTETVVIANIMTGTVGTMIVTTIIVNMITARDM